LIRGISAAPDVNANAFAWLAHCTRIAHVYAIAKPTGSRTIFSHPLHNVRLLDFKFRSTSAIHELYFDNPQPVACLLSATIKLTFQSLFF